MKRACFIAVLVAILVGCQSKEPVSQLKEINEALEKANFIIDEKNHFAYEDMAGKLYDPRTHDRALIWGPKVQVIWRRAFESKSLINSLKYELIKQSDSLKNLDQVIVKKILSADGNGGKLFEKLVLFKDSAFNIFHMAEELNKDSIFFYKKVLQIDITGYSKTDWLYKNFNNSSPMLALMTLSKIEANVINSESVLVNYCNMKVIYNFCGYFMPEAIAALNNSIVKSGDTIRVTAGVGFFNNETNPRITINGTRMKLYEYPVLRYEFIATGKPGTYNVPVKIEYTESDGSRKTETMNLGYIIAENK